MRKCCGALIALTFTLLMVMPVWGQQQPPGPPPGPGAPVPGMPGPGPGGPMFGQPGMPPHLMRQRPACPFAAVVPPVGMFFQFAGEHLQLTDEQKAKLNAAMTKYEERQRTLRDKSSEAAGALREAVMSPDSDDKKIEELAAKSQKAEAAMTDEAVKVWADIRSILTKDQMSKLKELLTAPPRPMHGMPGPPPPAPGQENAPRPPAP